MTATLIQGAGTAGAAPAPAPAAKPGKVTEAVDIARARVAARTAGHRVEAVSERSETATTWVNPNGTFTTEVAAGPIRFYDQQARGWRNVDVTLGRGPDGSVASKAHPHGLKLGTGSTPRMAKAAPSAAPAVSYTNTDLVTLGEGDQQITLKWRGSLPTPKLDGARAEYTDAVPGGDVVIEATRAGFEQFVELKRRPAVEGYSYTLPLTAGGLKVEQQPDGSVQFTDRKSRKTAVMPTPVMWDSTVDPVSGEHTRKVPVAMKVVQGKGTVDLVVTPDAKFLADPATKYPVTVDPSTSSLGSVFDTYVQQGETIDWSNDTELDLGNPGTKNANGTFRTARSFITWNTTPIADALVANATLSLWNFHSGNTDCVAQPWEVWSAGAPSTASRWTNQPAMGTEYATSTETRGNPGCASAPDGWINADVTTLVQAWASAKAPLSSMGLRASSETVVGQWKRVNSANATANPPKLTVNYNYRPQTGTKQEAGPPFVQDKTPAWRVETTTPTLRDTFADKDGDKVNGTFQIFDAATNTQVGTTLVSPFVPAGTPASVVVPAGVLQHGRTYRFRTSPYDGTHYSNGWSPWSNWTTFTVSPLPDPPQDFQAGAQQTLTPILSAVVTTPSQSRVNAEFTVKDSAGQPVPDLPLPPVSVESGSRAALQIPEGKLVDGGTYRWSVRACTGVGCSPWSAEQSLTVRVQPLPPMPATRSLVVGDAALAGVSVASECDAPGCATPPSGRLRVGTADGHLWATHLKADLVALPKGARVTSAKLALTRSDCTAQCAVQQPDLYELSSPWTPAQSGKELVAAAGNETYASGTALTEIDLGMLVQSWIDRGGNEGMALTVPGAAAGAEYHSGAAPDAAQRPRLTIEYLPPTAPGAVSDVVATAGDKGLLATWNAPLDGGANGETTYVVKAEKGDGTVVGTWEGTALRAVFTGLDNTLSHRIAVTPKNSVGNGPVSRSALVQGAAVAGGDARYKDYIQAYLSARNKVVTGVSRTTADAAAESPHGAVFSEVLDTQEAAIVANAEALATKGQSYVGISSVLADSMTVNGSSGRVLVRTTVVQTVTLRIDGVDQLSEDRYAKRFVFAVSGGTVKLESESDDSEAGQTLSATAAAGAQVVALPADGTGVPADDSGSLVMGEDGFPVADAPAEGVRTAAYVNGSGTASWAYNNAGRIPREYGSNDCTNFVSKAMYYGGRMKMRYGFWWSDSAWWKNPPSSWKKNSNTWSAAENLRKHFGYRQKYYITQTYNLRAGDILLFKWRGAPRYDHAAVVTGNNHGAVRIAQHGYSAHDTLSSVISRNRSKGTPISSIIAIRPVGA
ncbi:hypothetical protein BGK67_26165 [Streptomyces subrutilus]|uniref:Fibronectin type-III domain-containing protein n=2 Tax=Streptomyces subrutilus TaxID=36818 RepID=A0A1E5PY39_9ACTN|nr:hypothetical protein BGK67_26165 [Streptomyces subrutilus]